MTRLLSVRLAASLMAGAALSALAQPALAQAGTNATQAAPAFTTQLPTNVRPLAYAITLAPDAAAMSFTGKVSIDLDVTEPTATITLNALDLAFVKASVDGVAAKVSVDAEAQTATFTLPKPLKAGRHTLAIDYSGKIGTQASGLFALDYGAGADKKRALYTQFEAADARRVIPSWDEPAHKATFTLDLIVKDSDGMAVSNMPVTGSAPAGKGLTRYSFAASPKMSTYLLFLGIGDFERKAEAAAGTEIGVVTKRGDLPKAEFALKAGGEIVDWYNDYFATAYPLPKLDHIAAPGRSQFFSAMENWGAVFYFEHAMLLDPKISTSADKQRVFTVVAHEVAHQWFGNLVTMGWWDDLWLNEGFASWMESKATEHFHPEWNPALDAVISREGAMSLDAMVSTHPIIVHIDDPDALGQAFDAITYQKGEAVIRMLETYVGADAWRAGVRRYMKANAYGNTRTDDLWSAVEAEAGKPVTRIAHQFTLQPGVPMIRVESATCKAGQTRISLTQGEFTKDRPGKVALSWDVPVTASAGGAPVTVLVSGGKGEALLPGCGAPVVNAGQSGYYRTLYAPKVFKGLVKGYGKLASVDQLGLLSDAWALGLAGQQPASGALDLVKALPTDAAPQIWSRSAGIIDAIADYAGTDPARRAAVSRFATARLAPKLAALGWSSKAGERDVDANLRNALISVLGNIGDATVVAEARRRFAADATDPIPGAQRKAILNVVAVNADRATWDKLHALAKAETVPLVRSEYYRLLASARDPELAKAALELSLSGEPSETDAAQIISSVSDRHAELAFDFAAANRATVEAKVDASARTRFIVGLADTSLDPAMADKVEAWAAENIPASARRAAETAAATIRYRAQVRSQRMPMVYDWLAKAGR